MDRPFTVTELDHVVLRCRDTEAQRGFYVSVLGLAEERRIEAIGLIQLRAGASMVDLVPASAVPPPLEGNVDHFCLGVRAGDLDAVLAYLAAAGVETIGEPTSRYGARGAGPSIYLRDPEGNVVELKGMPDGA